MAGKQKAASAGAGISRLVPVQKRSRERYEHILGQAAALLAEKGSEAFRMSELVERTGVAFGSLYQYFPDKTAIIGTLAERCNQAGRDCVARDLSAVETVRDLHPALCRIVDSYYRMFIDVPVMRDIWQATQGDRVLQKLDREDVDFLADLLASTLRRVAADLPKPALQAWARLVMTLIAAAVRHAITLPPKEGRLLLATFKRMLPTDLSML
ncbi:TetR/AcrR family transcriptional regulator [Bradyrhizobium sp.]|uniref:TetR/AcrR family transcriptional regulator n=1 Tax=Bradyrhizobium sp. TaxID=376 RepID=UPI001D6C7114|nr:TetR/AcrR family transcriptional regulator [Bradyrhizobium sp.]MBI5323101.1 TetR family transcriptional regulator [Bradyrhizobium sp.]